MSGGVEDVADQVEAPAGEAPAAAQKAIAALRERETRALHIIAQAARRVMTRPAADLLYPSLGAALVDDISADNERVRGEFARQKIMLARLEALDAPHGRVLQLFCDMADACRRKLAELQTTAVDQERAIAMLVRAGPLLGRSEDVELLADLTGGG